VQRARRLRHLRVAAVLRVVRHIVELHDGHDVGPDGRVVRRLALGHLGVLGARPVRRALGLRDVRRGSGLRVVLDDLELRDGDVVGALFRVVRRLALGRVRLRGDGPVRRARGLRLVRGGPGLRMVLDDLDLLDRYVDGARLRDV
jgi:hypothetical protein